MIIQQEENMNLRQLLIAGAGAATLTAFALPAAAAPTIGAYLKTVTTENSTVESVTYRRCWSHDGRRHCGYGGRTTAGDDEGIW